MNLNRSEILFRGQGLSKGVAIDRPYFLNSLTESVNPESITPEQLDQEIHFYRSALEKCRQDIQQLQQQMEREHVLEGAAILEGHLHILGDPLITSNIEEKIRERMQSAPYVFQQAVKEYGKRFEKIREPFFRERYKDLKDLSNRILHHLLRKQQISHHALTDPIILVSHEITASEVAEMDAARVKGIITQEGSATSHAAIVARAKGIPYISNIDIQTLQSHAIDELIIDGENGAVYLFPTRETAHYYQSILLKVPKIEIAVSNMTTFCETMDGYHLKVLANVDLIEEVGLVHQFHGDGIGLIRTEFLYLTRDDFPSEQEQTDAYSEMVKGANGLPLTFRTFDIGGDKLLGRKDPYYETNPFLGCRAIRLMFKEQDVFKNQLRAMLRASKHGQIKIMFPMISSLQELKKAKDLLRECHQELAGKGVKVPYPKVGCMIEVPSAAIISDLLAAECDFLSIGTNDLVQYALAVDRGNHEMSSLYAATDPSILRLIKYIVAQANIRGISLSVCGEIAADPVMIPLLIGLGVHELSVASRNIVQVRDQIRATSATEAAHQLERTLRDCLAAC